MTEHSRERPRLILRCVRSLCGIRGSRVDRGPGEAATTALRASGPTERIAFESDRNGRWRMSMPPTPTGAPSIGSRLAAASILPVTRLDDDTGDCSSPSGDEVALHLAPEVRRPTSGNNGTRSPRRTAAVETSNPGVFPGRCSATVR